MRQGWSRLGISGVLVVLTLAGPARGFDPPDDQAGPLRVRIEGPGELTRLDAPVKVRLVLENGGETPVRGTLELGLIDGWTARPTGRVAFAVAAKAKADQTFDVTPSAASYDALYPIHAFARFGPVGREQTAHSILIVGVKTGRPPRVGTAIPWKPAVLPERGELALWRLKAYRMVIAIPGVAPRTLPTGERGRDEPTYATLDLRPQILGGESREVVAIHPPWRDGKVGTAAIEYPVTLPAQGPIRLRFETAVTPDGTGDGVAFRVRAAPIDAPAGTLGTVVFDRQSAAKRWGESAEANLDAFAGRSIRLQLESHPGAKNDTSFDQSFWGNPTLRAGLARPLTAFPPTGTAGSVVVGTIRSGNQSSEVRVWPGPRGLLDAAIRLGGDAKPVYFQGFEVTVLGDRLDDPRSPTVLSSVKTGLVGGAFEARHHFEASAGAFDLVGRLSVDPRGALRAHFQLENVPETGPWTSIYLEDVALGSWSRTVRQVYAGHGNVVRDPTAYDLGFDGHRLATSFVGLDFKEGPSLVQGVDLPPIGLQVRPAEKRYSLHASHALTFTLIPAENVFEAVKTWRDLNGLKAAGGVRKAAGRFVFDLWGGRYADAAQALRQSFRYGLGDSMVVWHNWQRWGYDYRLPDIYPPNPKFGQAKDLNDLIAACEKSGTLFALHDNYIDIYPDAEGFSYASAVAFEHDGRPVRAWLNEGRGAQSYRLRADRIEPFLARNLGKIRAELAPSAYFIDVWSSIRPYDYWTADGAFHSCVETRDTWGRAFARIRTDLGNEAPQISESGHDQLIGWLDGAQTNHLRVQKTSGGRTPGVGPVWDWDCAEAERTPWFDAAHHDRFILHGAGYPSRYEGGLDPRLHGIYSDDYIATEVLTGHPAMVSEPFNQNVVRKHWLLNDLMRSLALRAVEGVEYVGDDLHRQHVRWSGGGEVWVNRGETDWEIGGRILPSYGYLARVPTTEGAIESSISRRNGLIVEEARSPGQVYVNGRANIEGSARIRPELTGVRLNEGRSVSLALLWKADDPIPEQVRPFVHLCDDRGAILFQAGMEPTRFAPRAVGTLRALAHGSLPANLKPGETFEVRVGLYDPQSGGERLRLTGKDDGEGRIRLGRVRVDGQGDRLTGLSFAPIRPEPDPALPRQNPSARPVDFGSLVTAGGVRIARDRGALVVTPLPAGKGRPFDLRVRLKSLPWPSMEPNRLETLAEDGRVLSLAKLNRTGDEVVLTCQPGVFQYRLSTGK